MSVVGPRPHLPEYNAYYQNVVGQELMDKRHDAHPGADRAGPNPRISRGTHPTTLPFITESIVTLNISIGNLSF
jgi:hypothetical protein